MHKVQGGSAMMGGAVSRRLIGEFTPEELEIIEHPNRALMIKHGQRDKERERIHQMA